MSRNFIQRGAVIDYVNGGSAIASGDVVVMGHTVGVALTDIANGATGAVAIEGVYELPKVSAAVFAVGEKLIYDVSAEAFDDSSAVPDTGDLTGAAVAVQAGADGETTCRAKLIPGNASLAT